MNFKSFTLAAAALLGTMTAVGETTLANGVYNPEAILHFQEYRKALEDGQRFDAKETSSLLTEVKARPQQVMRRSAYDPKGSLYCVVPRHRAGSYAFYGTIDHASGQVTPVYRSDIYSNGEDYDSQCGAVRNGILYIPQFVQNMVTSEVEIRWKRIEVATGRELSPLSFGGQTYAYLYSMAYDEANDRFVGLAMDLNSGGMGILVIVDCQGRDDNWTVLNNGNIGGTEGNFMGALAYNPADQSIYGLKDNGRMYMVDVDWGDTMVVKEFDQNEWFLVPEYPFSMPMTYSPRDRAMVTVYRDNVNERMLLGYIDMDDNSGVMGQELNPISFVSTLYCADSYADDEAPDAPALTAVAFDGPALSGTISFTAPEVTFAGEKLTSNVLMTLTLNGEEYFSKVMAPGEAATLDLQLPEGFYSAELVATPEGDKTLVSPAARQAFYVGHDNPMPPTDLVLADDVLSWKAPADGEHGGYVDLSGLTYDIYLDAAKLNEAPVSGCSFKLPEIETLGRRTLTVTATADAHTSAPSEGLVTVIGRALSLPISMQPDSEQVKLFNTVNSNGDENEFKYTMVDGHPAFRIATGYYYQMPDDWVFLPQANFSSAEVVYALQMLYCNAYQAPEHLDNLEIWIGSAADPEHMYRQVYSHADHVTPEPVELEARFTVPAAGDYVVGIHATGGDQYKYRGVTLSDFRLAAVEGSSVYAPDDAVVTVDAAPEGRLAAMIHLTAPTVALNGTTLDGPVTFTASCGAHTATCQVEPGKSGDMELEVDADGYHEIAILPSNAHGEGITRYYRVFCGMDKPDYPDNVMGMASADNLTYTLTWEAPSEGVNGGFVDPTKLTYEIYLYRAGGSHLYLASTDKLTYTYEYGAQAQSYPSLGVCAVNELGDKSEITFVADYLGIPNELPMTELFGYTKFDYKWQAASTGEYSGSAWDSVSSMDGMGIGDPAFNAGALMCSNLGGGNGFGKLIATKFSSLNYPAINLTLRFWDYPEAADVEIWACSEGKREEVKIASITPERGTPKWVDWVVPLPEDYLDQPWVQLNVRCDVSKGRSLLIDSYSIAPDITHDFKVAALYVPYSAIVGQFAKVGVTVINSGQEAGTSAVTLQMLADGEVVQSQDFAIGRTQPGGLFERDFYFDLPVTLMGKSMSVRAYIEDVNDQIPGNNERVVPFLLRDSDMPVVTDLEGDWTDASHNSVDLAWGTPDATFGAFESFESTPSFEITDNIAGWLNVDMDGLPQFAIQNAHWAGSDDPSAWTVFDASEAGTMDDERLSPHSGTKMLIARAVAYNEGVDEPKQNHDWLISPEVVGGTVVDFWMNIISTTYPETVAIYYSTTDREVSSFVKGRNFTKSGQETWEHLSWTLPANARYFALVYESWGTFAAMIDDISFTPAQPQMWDIKSYDIWRADAKGEKLVAEGVTANAWRDEAPVNDATYYVCVNVDRGEGVFTSPRSNPVLVKGESIVEGVGAEGVIGSGNGFIFVGGFAGQPVAVYTLDGRKAAGVALAADREELRVAPGIYTVTAGKTVVKVMVK